MPNEWRSKIIAVPDLIRAATEAFFHHSSAIRLNDELLLPNIGHFFSLFGEKDDSKVMRKIEGSEASSIDQRFYFKKLTIIKGTSSTDLSASTISMNVE